MATGVSALGAERSLALTRFVLAAVLVVNWISISLVQNAGHLPGETEAQLTGDWRGLYYHKNIAGAVSAITAILFFFRVLDTRRLGPRVLFAAAVGGLGILVTEHDVDDSGGPTDVAARDSAVGDASRRFLDVMIEGGAAAILTWGLSDRYLDPPDWRETTAGYHPRRLPLDRDFRRKPMWHAIAGALSEN